MYKELVPKDVKPTGKEDLHGNMGYGVTFSTGEQAFILAKKAPEVGVAEYGEIVDVEKKGKPGETYKRFYRKPREDGEGKHYNVSSSPKSDEGMAWGNALNCAATLGGTKEEVLATARFFYENRPSAVESSAVPVEVAPTPKAQEVSEDQISLTDDVDLDSIPF